MQCYNAIKDVKMGAVVELIEKVFGAKHIPVAPRELAELSYVMDANTDVVIELWKYVEQRRHGGSAIVGHEL